MTRLTLIVDDEAFEADTHRNRQWGRKAVFEDSDAPDVSQGDAIQVVYGATSDPDASVKRVKDYDRKTIVKVETNA